MCLKSVILTRLEQNTWIHVPQNCTCMRYWNIFKIRMTFFDWMRELFTPSKWRSWQRFPNMSHSNPSPLCITSTVHKAILYVHGSPPGSPSALKGAGQISQLMYNMSQSVEKLLLLHMKFSFQRSFCRLWGIDCCEIQCLTLIWFQASACCSILFSFLEILVLSLCHMWSFTLCCHPEALFCCP